MTGRESMESVEEALVRRRTSRTRKRTSKGEEYEESMQGSSPLILLPSAHIELPHTQTTDPDTEMSSAPDRHDEKIGVLAAAGTKRKPAPFAGNPAKKPRKSFTGKKNDVSQNGPGSSFKIPSQNAGRAVVDRYQLPSFDDMEIRSALVFDDGATDDWTDFDGNTDHAHGNIFNQPAKTALMRNVASMFITRAKLAQQAKMSWTGFEERERSIDSAAVTETDPERRRIQARDALNNGLRLAILDKLAPRLCVEVWGTAYTPNAVDPAASGAGPEIPPPVEDRESYEDDPDRTVKKWVPGGKHGAVPVFNDDDSDASSILEFKDEDWMVAE